MEDSVRQGDGMGMTWKTRNTPDMARLQGIVVVVLQCAYGDFIVGIILNFAQMNRTSVLANGLG